jgi:rsbT co-antagonist protein RsbR
MSVIPQILRDDEQQLLTEWIRDMGSSERRADLLNAEDLRQQCDRFLRLLQQATHAGDVSDISGESYALTRDFLADLSDSRARHGFSPTETARFVFSLKKPLFSRLSGRVQNNAHELTKEIQTASELIDRLGLYTTEVFLKAREAMIARHQQEMLELSTPVVKLWEGILALPLIGTLDSARTQIVMESLLQKVVDTGSIVAIIDITGVPTVDTLVAQHLMKTVTAARLMGADCIISGIRPQIAQTIVHLGVALGDITTKATLADAFLVALERTGSSIRNAPVESNGKGRM